MSILNQSELTAAIAARTADNTSGDISPADIRANLTDMIDSLQEYAGVMSGSSVASVPATTVPTKAAIFSVNNTSANELLEADHVNDLIKVKEPGLYRITLRAEAQWPTTEDLKLLVYVNGAASLLTPFEFTEAGAGASNPKSFSFTAVAFIVQAADIAAGPGNAYAEVELYFGSGTGDFTVNIVNKSTFGVAYSPLSIRTVG